MSSLLDLGSMTNQAIALGNMAQNMERNRILEQNAQRAEANARRDAEHTEISHLLEITKNPLTQHTPVAVTAMKRVEQLMGIQSNDEELAVGLESRRKAAETALDPNASQEDKMNAYIKAAVYSPSLTTQMLDSIEKAGNTGLKQYQLLTEMKLQDAKIRELNQRHKQIGLRNDYYSATGGILNRVLDAVNVQDAEGKRTFGPVFNRLLSAENEDQRRVTLAGYDDLSGTFRQKVEGIRAATTPMFEQLRGELGPLKDAIDQAQAQGKEVLPEDLAKVKTLELVDSAKGALDAWADDPYDRKKYNRLQNLAQQVRMASAGTEKELRGLDGQREGLLNETRRRVDLQYAKAEREQRLTDNLAAAQVEFGQLPAIGQTPQNAAKIASKFPGILPEDVMKAVKNPNQAMVSINNMDDATVAAQKEFMKSAKDTYDRLKHAPAAIVNMEKAKALIPQAKGFMGPAGESLMEAAKFLNNRLGLKIDTEGIQSAEELRTRIFFNVMDNLKKLDAQPSQLQQQIMMDSLGKIGTDPNALPRILDAFSDDLREKVEIHNREVSSAEERGVRFPYNPRIEMPGKAKKKEEAKAAEATPDTDTLTADEQAELDKLRKKYGRR